MTQWTNVNQNNGFVNPPALPWLSEISETIHLALPDLTAGRWQAGRQNAGKFENSKTHCISKHSNVCFIRMFASFNQGRASSMHS